MKNKKGEIATLLTLGLVVVGTLITLGTSLFVSNKKTNLASNSRAGTTYSCCKVYETSSACGGNKRIQNQGNAFTSTCTANNLVECSTVGGPSTAGASICPTSGPAAGAENGACRSAAPKCDGNLTCTGGVCVKPPTGPAAGAENGACRSAAPKCDGTLVCTDNKCVKPPAGPAVGTQGGACRSAAPKCDGALVCNTSSICAASTSEGQTANQITANTAVADGQSCCFQKKGKVYVYATYQSMVNNDMLDDAGNPDCGRLTNSVVSSYTADNPPGAFVCAGGTANMTSITSYNQTNTTNVSGTTGETNGELVVPEGCTGTNCQAYFTNEANFSATVLISTNKTGPATYYKSGNCADGTKVNTLNDLQKYCKDQSSAEASITCVSDQKCSDRYTGANKNKYAYSISGSDTTYYKGSSCYGTTAASGDTDLKTYCTEDPAAEANADCKKDVSCSVANSTNTQTKISSKTFSNKTVYYENNDCSGTAVDIATVKAYCDSNMPPVNPIENVIKDEAAVNNYICALIPQEKYTGAAVLSPFVKKCEAAAKNINAPIFKVIISDYDVEGWVTADYMNCCIK
jgi:hypothetical protein